MAPNNPTLRIAALSSLTYLALVAGCAAPVIRSQRLHGGRHTLPAIYQGHDHALPHDCESCGSRQRLRDLAPYVAGPLMHHQRQPYAPQQATIQPPHSKFHPVPTRPVFEQRHSYSPPDPIGVQLVPVPEDSFGPNAHAPAVIFPDIGLPPVVEELPWTPMSDEPAATSLLPPEDA